MPRAIGFLSAGRATPRSRRNHALMSLARIKNYNQASTKSLVSRGHNTLVSKKLKYELIKVIGISPNSPMTSPMMRGDFGLSIGTQQVANTPFKYAQLTRAAIPKPKLSRVLHQTEQLVGTLAKLSWPKFARLLSRST